MATAASSSSSGSSWEYDVFINFRGEDTRRGFVCHLYNNLRRKVLDTFIDSEKLRKGDDLSELLNAIQGSRLSLVVFSENYASSTWCLKELVQILKCMDTQNQIVVPIFYQVDPSDVRKFKASFGEALAKHDRDSAADMEEMESWKSSLIRATNLSGWDSKNDQDDAKLMEDIVEDVFNKLSHISAIRDDGLVGMDSHMNEMEKLLCLGVVDVRFVGIWGMGGIGKTTIARAVYNKIEGQFDHCCFLKNIKEGFRATNGAKHVQKELLSGMLKEEIQILSSLDKGLNMIRERLGKKKVVLVLDDVDNLGQIEDLIGKKPSFGGGSRIIITTRDKHLLGGYVMYEPKSFTDDKALELFRQYAFKTNPPSRSYDDLSTLAIECAHGLPLALKVLGAFLDNKSPREWEDQLEKIKRIPDPGIQGVLKTSFDGLDDSQKNIFLDIACFFRGEHKGVVTKFLDSCGFFPHSGLGVLVDRALITISKDGMLDMHDLLQEMGWALGRLSRVWNYEDAERMLNQNVDTEAVEAIVLDLDESEEVYLNTEAFVSMPKLRLLKLSSNGSYNDRCLLWDSDSDSDSDYDEFEQCKQYVSGELNSLSHELRFLIWHGSPLKSLPANFHPKNLVYLDMPHCHLEQLWEGTKPLKNLKRINLSRSEYLKKLPDLTEATNLMEVTLVGCISLLEVHPSISGLKHLVCLNLKRCKKLKSLPSSIHMNSLKLLDLSGCLNLEEFPEISEDMKELSRLNLDETAIKKLPSSINNLSGLQTLRLGGCRKLRSLPSSIHLKSLKKVLDLSGCSNLEEFPKISGDMKELSSLKLDETAIKEVPSSIEFLQGLQTLTMSYCISLVRLPDNICKLARLKELHLYGCSKLSNLPENLGDLKHLSDLGVLQSGIQQLPFSILLLSELKYLVCKGCKEMTAPFSSWPTWIEENPSYSVLVDLDLSDCNLLELSDSIAHLTSLESLDLSGNNKLESLPAAMNRLVRLSNLYLYDCKRLKSIPELSSSIEFINAEDCTTLKTVSTPKPPYLEKSFNRFIFYNCFQLQTNLFIDIVENADNYHLGGLLVSLPARSDIPDWFNHQCRGSSVTVQLPPNWLSDKFVGLAICAITNLRVTGYRARFGYPSCWCTFKANDGDEESFHFDVVHNTRLESDHMLMAYGHSGLRHDGRKYTEARFRIVTRGNDSMTSLEDCSWITSCGVRLLHVNNEDSFSVELFDSERSKRKRETPERERETMGSEEEEGCSGGPICCCFSLTGCTIALRKRQRQGEGEGEGEGEGVTGATGSETQEEDVSREGRLLTLSL